MAVMGHFRAPTTPTTLVGLAWVALGDKHHHPSEGDIAVPANAGRWSWFRQTAQETRALQALASWSSWKRTQLTTDWPDAGLGG